MTPSSPIPAGRLEELDHDQLLQTARRLLAEADALSSRIAAVNEIGVAMNRTLDLNEVLRVVAKQAKWLLDFDHCSVCLRGTQDAEWDFKSLFGQPIDPAPEVLKIDSIQRALTLRQPQVIRDAGEVPFLSGFVSGMIVPLQADNLILGTVNFASKKPATYTNDDMRIGYMLALQLSAAIRNARNFEELESTRDELRERADELQARNEELDAFSHTIAHDLKSPLTSILLRGDILNVRFKDALPPTAADMIVGIQTSGKQMSNMIDQLLWLARLRRIEDAATAVDMRAAAIGAALRFTHLTDAAKITVEVLPDLPCAFGHAQLAEEVFANLISNAIKYMGDKPEKRITVRGSVIGERVRYEVEDNGIGISPEDQARLFQMFTRLHTISAEGVGLGLSIVRRIVTRLKGTAGVSSTPGRGSTFWFELPALADPPAAPILVVNPATAPTEDTHNAAVTPVNSVEVANG